MRIALIFLPMLALASPSSAQQPRGSFTVAESGQRFSTLEDAVRAVRDDEATILIAPGTYRQCVVQSAGKITFKAEQPGTVIFEKEACEQKAALVLRGRGSAVDGIIFRGYFVPDGNGAGIRIEMGDLHVSNSMFLDSEEGILGGHHPSVSNIMIERSTFAGLGQCDSPSCSHSIYLALDGKLTVRNSRFERGTGGHYVKVRAREVEIVDNSFDDSKGRRTNYMIDLSEGGTGLIARNMFVQGPQKENRSALIIVAPEATTYSAAGLQIRDNVASMAPGATGNPAFVADLSRSKIVMEGNRLTGMRPFEQR